MMMMLMNGGTRIVALASDWCGTQVNLREQGVLLWLVWHAGEPARAGCAAVIGVARRWTCTSRVCCCAGEPARAGCAGAPGRARRVARSQARAQTRLSLRRTRRLQQDTPQSRRPRPLPVQAQHQGMVFTCTSTPSRYDIYSTATALTESPTELFRQYIYPNNNYYYYYTCLTASFPRQPG